MAKYGHELWSISGAAIATTIGGLCAWLVGFGPPGWAGFAVCAAISFLSELSLIELGEKAAASDGNLYVYFLTISTNGNIFGTPFWTPLSYWEVGTYTNQYKDVWGNLHSLGAYYYVPIYTDFVILWPSIGGHAHLDPWPPGH